MTKQVLCQGIVLFLCRTQYVGSTNVEPYFSVFAELLNESGLIDSYEKNVYLDE